MLDGNSDFSGVQTQQAGVVLAAVAVTTVVLGCLRLTWTLLAAVLVGLLLLPLLPGGVAAGAGHGSAPSHRGPDGRPGVRLLMSGSDRLGCTQTGGRAGVRAGFQAPPPWGPSFRKQSFTPRPPWAVLQAPPQRGAPLQAPPPWGWSFRPPRAPLEAPPTAPPAGSQAHLSGPSVPSWRRSWRARPL